MFERELAANPRPEDGRPGQGKGHTGHSTNRSGTIKKKKTTLSTTIGSIEIERGETRRSFFIFAIC